MNFWNPNKLKKKFEDMGNIIELTENKATYDNTLEGASVLAFGERIRMAMSP